jgi:catechol 2,3-dioxygenase-like lactoylglutathione lyase family enzyme
VTARAAWAGVIVSDLPESIGWYAAQLGMTVLEQEPAWAKLGFPNRTTLELYRGDPTRPGGVFPSYGTDDGPPVLPGYAVDSPEELAETEALRVARALPGWVVVAAPDRLRLVLLEAEVGKGRGLVGFRFTSTASKAQRHFLDRLTIFGPEVVDGEVAVVPVVLGQRTAVLTDPDGTAIAVVGA